MKTCVAAVECGTSVIKAVVFDLNGEVKARCHVK